MTHIPVHPSQFPRFRANIHGHLHHKVIADPRYINVSVERTGLRPVLIDALLAAVEG
jgi:calcineurin-like phosphoesterase family protein